MKYLVTLAVSCALYSSAAAQQVVVDPQHLAAVIQNGAVRSGAESTHQQYLSNIEQNIEDLNTNVGSVVVAQNMIYNGLSNVNSALRNGLAVQNMAVIIADMTSYIDQAIALARDEPYLLLFAGNITSQMRSRATALMTEVSAYILKEGDNLLADYNSRDQLLRKVTQHLQILDGMAYGAYKNIYWAKQRGLIASATPFANYIDLDRAYVSRILQQAKYLKP